VELHKKHGRDVACISVSFDEAGEQGEVLKFLQEQQATFDNVLSLTTLEPFGLALQQKLKLTEAPNLLPVVLVFGKDGKLAKQFGEAHYEKDIIPFAVSLL